MLEVCYEISTQPSLLQTEQLRLSQPVFLSASWSSSELVPTCPSYAGDTLFWLFFPPLHFYISLQLFCIFYFYSENKQKKCFLLVCLQPQDTILNIFIYFFLKICIFICILFRVKTNTWILCQFLSILLLDCDYTALSETPLRQWSGSEVLFTAPNRGPVPLATLSPELIKASTA